MPAQGDGPRREEISFPGNIVVGQFCDHGTLCTASFPGELVVTGVLMGMTISGEYRGRRRRMCIVCVCVW